MFLFNKKKTDSIRITDFIYQHISKSKSMNVYKKQQYRNLARHLDDFEKQTGICPMSDAFTEQVAEEFIIHLRTKKRPDRRARFGYLLFNTVKNIIGHLSSMISKADKAGYSVNYGYKDIRLREESTSSAVYLTIKELNHLNRLQGLSKEAAAVRDRFLVGCFTALRISDLKRLTVADNFTADCIRIKTQKTGETVQIPIHL